MLYSLRVKFPKVSLLKCRSRQISCFRCKSDIQQNVDILQNVDICRSLVNVCFSQAMTRFYDQVAAAVLRHMNFDGLLFK